MGRESSVQGQRCAHERRGTDCAGPEGALRALLDEVLTDKVLRRGCIPSEESAVGREDEEGEGEEESAHDLALERELQGVQLRLQGHTADLLVRCSVLQGAYGPHGAVPCELARKLHQSVGSVLHSGHSPARSRFSVGTYRKA